MVVEPPPAAFTRSFPAPLARRRRLWLSLHIILLVALFVDTGALLALAVRVAGMTDPLPRVELQPTLRLLGVSWGLPLSTGTLATAIGLGLATRWGVLRYPWTVAKLLLFASVILVGGTIISPTLNAALIDGLDPSPAVIAAAIYELIALTAATALGLFKPGGPFRVFQSEATP